MSMLLQWLSQHIIQVDKNNFLLTVSGLLSDNISCWGNTSDVMQLVLLHIAWKIVKQKTYYCKETKGHKKWITCQQKQ